MQNDNPRIPKIGEYVRSIGTLVAIEDVTPPPPPKQLDYIFEDVDAVVELWICGAHQSEIGSFCAWGDKSAVAIGAEKAQKYVADLNLKPMASDVDVRVYEVRGRVRKRPANGVYNSANEFMHFESLNGGQCRALPADVRTLKWSSAQGGDVVVPPDWDMCWDDKDAVYWEMVSPYHNEGSPIMFRIRETDAGWRLDSDAELMVSLAETLRFKTVDLAKAYCEADYLRILNVVDAEKREVRS